MITKQQSLWEYAEATPPRVQPCVATPPKEHEQARRATVRRLRASGHWLTLLRVARTIPQPFTLNDVSVAVWRACPEFFGMKGYPYPDNHKVHYILYGDRGLIAKGLVRRVRSGVFSLPDDLDPENLPIHSAAGAEKG